MNSEPGEAAAVSRGMKEKRLDTTVVATATTAATAGGTGVRVWLYFWQIKGEKEEREGRGICFHGGSINFKEAIL